jgi:hypothetical protein
MVLHALLRLLDSTSAETDPANEPLTCCRPLHSPCDMQLEAIASLEVHVASRLRAKGDGHGCWVLLTKTVDKEPPTTSSRQLPAAPHLEA